MSFDSGSVRDDRGWVVAVGEEGALGARVGGRGKRGDRGVLSSCGVLNCIPSIIDRDTDCCDRADAYDSLESARSVSAPWMETESGPAESTVQRDSFVTYPASVLSIVARETGRESSERGERGVPPTADSRFSIGVTTLASSENGFAAPCCVANLPSARGVDGDDPSDRGEAGDDMAGLFPALEVPPMRTRPACSRPMTSILRSPCALTGVMICGGSRM